MDQAKTALVLGATGGVGGDVARVLVARGWRMKALARKPELAPALGVEWIKGDAMQRADVVAAARGVGLIVHAVNPSGYRNWSTLVLPMIDNSIAAAREAGARIVLPGTIYNYGAASAPLLAEDTPQRPSSRKGAIRVQMESRLQHGWQRGVRVLVVRAGDFSGRAPATTGFRKVWPRTPAILAIPARAASATPGPTCPTWPKPWCAWSSRKRGWTPTRASMFAGTGTPTAARWWKRSGARGKPALPLRRVPWWALRLLSPFVALFGEMLEMRYLWQQPFALDNARLLRFLGSETHTPLGQAVAAALAGMQGGSV